MEFQEKSFEDLLKEDRLKRLDRQLKLQRIRGAANQQLPSSPHMSVSGLSSIYGDQGALSDFSFCAPSSSRVSSRAGSVVVASSLNLRTELLKNLKQREKTTTRVTSSEIDPRSDVERSVKDREIMPPPLPPKKFLTQSEKILEKPDVEVSNETGKNADSNSKQRGSRIFKNWMVRLNDKGQIVIKGRLESGELARSKAVKKRLNATTVISVLNHHYNLVGDINDFKEELPEYVRGKFYNGFPTDWENVRQIWQCYIASGSSSRFRWPRPIADSDDDLRSDITEVAVSRSTRSSVSKTPVTASRPGQNFGQETSGKKVVEKTDSLRGIRAMDLELSSVNLPVNEDFNNGIKTSTSVMNASNEMKRTIGEAGNRSVNLNREIETTNGSTACMNCGKLVPRWKIDTIVDNLLNKNCSKEYIDKVITAMDCLNELFSFSPTTTTTTTTTTTMNDNPETAPDEGVSMNSNSNMQHDSTKDRIKSKSSQEIVSTESQKQQSMISNSNSYSLESSDQSENESSIIRNKQNDSTIRCSVQLSQFPCKNPVVAVKQSSQRFVDGISNHGENRIEEGTAKKYGNRIDRIRKGGKVFNASLSGMEGLQSSKASPAATNNLPPTDLNSRQILEPPTRSTLSNKMFRAEVESHDYGDSDISIIDGPVASTTKSKIHTSEKKKSVFVNDKDAGDNRTGSLYSEKTSNLHTEERNLDSSLSIPTLRSNKGITGQNDCRTPSKVEKSTPTRRKAAETSRRYNNSAESDAENVGMRMSSRGRRILPPLDYWNGERAVLRDQELIYTPGTPLKNSVSLEISQQSINPVTSNLTPVSTSINNIKQTNKDSVNQSKSGVNRRTRSRRNGQILREITDNREIISDHGMTSGSKSTSGRQIGRQRKIEKYVTSSSEEDNAPTANSKRKQRRLH